MKLWFWITLLVGLIFLDKDVDATNNQQGNNGNITCELPFQPIGDSCLLIDNDLQGPWQTMRDICQAFEADIVSLADANLLYDISNYIKDNEMSELGSYWVGANDLAEEGKWVWASDDSSVEMGIPLWGNYPQNQPDGEEDQNCGLLDSGDFFYLHDNQCNAKHGVICQKQQAVPPPEECPPSYEMIGGSCFHVYYTKSYTWDLNKKLCETVGAHAAKIDDANLFGELCDHIIKSDESCFWTGGFHLGSSEEDTLWLWHDGTPVPMGTPYWKVLDDTTQYPFLVYDYRCMAICYNKLFEDSMHFFNQRCDLDHYAICQYDL